MVLLIPSPNLPQLIRKPTPGQVEPFHGAPNRPASCVTVSSTWVPFLPVCGPSSLLPVTSRRWGLGGINYSARKGCSWDSTQVSPGHHLPPPTLNVPWRLLSHSWSSGPAHYIRPPSLASPGAHSSFSSFFSSFRASCMVSRAGLWCLMYCVGQRTDRRVTVRASAY